MTDITDSAAETLAEVTRGGIVESVHVGHVILLDHNGKEIMVVGNPNLSIFPRSAIKSIQASAMVRAGLKLPPRLLALVCASHSGSMNHQDAAREILQEVGLNESFLRNSADRPLGVDEGRAWGEKPATSLAQNCSGKHAGMLNTCKINGWPLESYLGPNHPLQIACRDELESLAEEKVQLTTIDGCGAPLFLISLRGLAKAIRNITLSEDVVHREVINSCRGFPEMVAGENRLTTRLMKEVDGLFLKEGAEGVEVGSMPDGRTFVFKVNDGSSRAHGTIISAVLEKLGVTLSPESALIYGGGQVVGSIRSNLS